MPSTPQSQNGHVSLLSASCPTPLAEYAEIVLAHGSGGRMSQRLIREAILPGFSNESLAALHDGAIIGCGNGRLAFTTDSYVVSPLFFPGGDIGELAVNGTVNDLAMCGARPLCLSVGFILEEGLPMADFRRVIASMRRAADAVGVSLVTGDTKVVDRGKADRLFVNVSGLGIMPDGVEIDPRRAQPGDAVLLSGAIGAHGIAILSVREGLEFECPIVSDTAPLNGMVAALLASGCHPRILRDPTRGGVASALTEIAESAGVGMLLDETAIPVDEAVRGACEILGLDPLHVANEGKMIAIVPAAEAPRALEALRGHPLGRQAAIIGEVTSGHSGFVMMRTHVGGTRVVDMLSGEQLPRIC